MTTKERPVDRGKRQWNRQRLELGAELRDVRLGAGLSQLQVARATRLSQMEVSRIERGQSRRVPAESLFCIASVLGLRLSLKAYPSGPPIRDAAHVALLATLRGSTSPKLSWRYEKPVTDAPDDGRAWDAEVTGTDFLVHVEAELRLYDTQALERRLGLKVRDGRPGALILLIRGSRGNRRLLAGPASALTEAYPIRTREIVAALGAGADPGPHGIALL